MNTQKGLTEFIDRLKTDKELAGKLLAADKAYTGDRNDLISLVNANILPIAAQEGYSFTAEEYAEHLKTAIEEKRMNGILPDEELSGVAGGVGDANVNSEGGNVTIVDNSTNYTYNEIHHYYINIYVL